MHTNKIDGAERLSQGRLEVFFSDGSKLIAPASARGIASVVEDISTGLTAQPADRDDALSILALLERRSRQRFDIDESLVFIEIAGDLSGFIKQALASLEYLFQLALTRFKRKNKKILKSRIA